jgi:UDP-2,3-diacylglucosamine pyrophosphatase LpxH
MSISRTLVISDIHLGNGAGYDIFAGEKELPAFLDSFAEPVRVVVNGDGVDFLMNEDPLELTVGRAVQQAKAIATHPATAGVFQALGRVLERGGAVIIRMGNHDLELYLPEVQEVFRIALGQPSEIASALEFQNGDQPMILDVGGSRILLAHGEHSDTWNRISYNQLVRKGDSYPAFQYPPGSQLVKNMLNPLKRKHGLRFADLIKPDMQGGFLTVLGVSPEAAKDVAANGGVFSLGWQLFRRSCGPFTFGEEGEPEVGLADRLETVGLDDAEREALEALLIDDGMLSFADDGGATNSAKAKLLQNGMKVYARAQRGMVGDKASTFFELAPDAAEVEEANRLAEKFGAQAVLLGHTHAARWARLDRSLFVNTGTWIWLMAPPPADAPSEEWVNYLDQLRMNPQLEDRPGAASPLKTIFTAAILDTLPEGGAQISLVEWKNGTSKILATDRV